MLHSDWNDRTCPVHHFSSVLFSIIFPLYVYSVIISLHYIGLTGFTGCIEWIIGANLTEIQICRKTNEHWFLATHFNFITARKRSLRRLCFYRYLSVHGGGMRGCSQGVCAWLLPWGVCMVGPGWGMGGCSGGGMHGIRWDMEIQSISGW